MDRLLAPESVDRVRPKRRKTKEENPVSSNPVDDVKTSPAAADPTSSPAPKPEETQEPEDPAGPVGPELTQAPPEDEETETPKPPGADDTPPEDEECDGLNGFETSPFEEGYGEALKSAIKEAVSCEKGASLREPRSEGTAVGEQG